MKNFKFDDISHDCVIVHLKKKISGSHQQNFDNSSSDLEDDIEMSIKKEANKIMVKNLLKIDGITSIKTMGHELSIYKETKTKWDVLVPEIKKMTHYYV
jgi:hypothetical protein